MAIRTDRLPGHRGAFEKNKKRIFATEKVCGICGGEVDFTLSPPAPLSPCIDHIIPVSKGGHPSDINNLQLAHWACNRQKSDKLFMEKKEVKAIEEVGNETLPLTLDWTKYKFEE